jgi:hypothetical protein
VRPLSLYGSPTRKYSQYFTDDQSSRISYPFKLTPDLGPIAYKISTRLSQPAVVSRYRLFSVGQASLDDHPLPNLFDLHISSLAFTDEEIADSYSHSHSGSRNTSRVANPYDCLRIQEDPTSIDVISKTPLDWSLPEISLTLRRCTRCLGTVEKRVWNNNGSASAGGGHMMARNRRWRAWLKRWETRCVCGGYWTASKDV